jgi:hypothetical protein
MVRFLLGPGNFAIPVLAVTGAGCARTTPTTLVRLADADALTNRILAKQNRRIGQLLLTDPPRPWLILAS